jgi:hypothetical protein
LLSWTSFTVRYAPVKTLDFGAGANTDNMRFDQLYCRHDGRCEAANPGCPLFRRSRGELICAAAKLVSVES